MIEGPFDLLLLLLFVDAMTDGEDHRRRRTLTINLLLLILSLTNTGQDHQARKELHYFVIF